ncbi:MAG: 50S ribosomal protein L11 methyltransferase [Burkholderiaceae bacterium]|nr:50S ribosomal protein L11 methyltransferase [Burkholderiaceae bacterium]
MWLRIRFAVDGIAADAWTDALLAAGASSVDTSDADADSEAECALFGEPGEPPPASAWPRTRIAALIAQQPSPAATCEALPAVPGEASARAPKTALAHAADDDRRRAGEVLARAAALALQPVPTEIELDRLDDQDWVQATQRQFDAFPVGNRLWITPTWHASVQPVPQPRASIVLDPGLAFGTGSHPTTRLCLEWLDENLHAGDTVIDYGCGSGILAIAAARLGARSVAGIDIDPQALAAAARNAADNGVAIELRSSGDAMPTPADVVVANILANPLRVLAPLLETLVAPGGRLVLAGLLDRQAEEIARCFRHVALHAWRSAEGWTCLAGTRRR